MAKRAFIAMLAYGVLGCLNASAQQLPVSSTCPYTSHPNSLACLIPDFTTNGQGNLSGFNTTVAQVLGELPLAAPVSGVVIGFNKKLAVPEDITENLGTILTERGNTVGKYKLFAGFTYQRFVFNTVDGTKLSNLPIVFSLPATSAANQIVGYAQNTLSANVTQYTGILAFGLTDRIDISAILPFQRVSLAGGYTTALEAQVPNTGGTPTKTGTCPQSPAANTGICSGTAPPFVGRTVAGSASGIGDFILVAKGTAYNGERAKLAVGLETRFPTGDVFNLLGTGAYGVKPYAVFSYFWGRFTPHANLGYQWNGSSVLRLNPFGGNLRLPDTLDYSAGADVGIVKRKLSVVADLVGQRFYNAPRIIPAAAVTAGGQNCTVGVCIPDTSTIPGPLQNAKLTSIGVNNSSYNVENMSVGLKWSPAGNLIISANVLLKLNDAGLRAKYVPLVGISYRF